MSDGMLTGIVKTSKFCEFQANRKRAIAIKAPNTNVELA
jgi:hypothetical protein